MSLRSEARSQAEMLRLRDNIFPRWLLANGEITGLCCITFPACCLLGWEQSPQEKPLQSVSQPTGLGLQQAG